MIGRIFILFTIYFCCFVPCNIIGQSDNQDQIVIDLNEIQNEPERVEIQRYTGYENLLFRYLTLPYDVSANTGNQGRYFDIGYILLALAPLTLLVILYRRKRLFYALMIFSTLYLMLSFCYSFINIGDTQRAERAANNWHEITANAQSSLTENVLISAYNLSYIVTSPIRKALAYITNQQDHITYPVISILLMIAILCILKLTNRKSKAQIFGLITISYFFLWLILSAGIIWYGFLLLPLLLGFTISIFERNLIRLSRYYKVLLLIPLISWIVFAYAARISNIDIYTAEENLGKSIVDPKLVYFSTGVQSAKDARSQVYINCGDTFDQINSNESLIYQIGTSMTFEISQNTTRVLQDNILISFFAYFKSDKTMNFIDEVLKPSGFSYIIIDLYTPTLDKTPEKSLTQKYTLFIETLYKSENVQLLATDRILEVSGKNREVKRIYDLFGKQYNIDHDISVVNFGSYAIYEIL